MPLLVDVATVLDVSVLPIVVGSDVITSVVGVGPSSIQVYMPSMSIITVCAQQATAHCAVRTCVDQFRCWLSTDVGSTDCPHLHSVELA